MGVIRVVIVTREAWRSLGPLNPNAFPESFRGYCFAAAEQLSLVQHAAEQVALSLELDRQSFLRAVQESNEFRGASPDPNKPSILLNYSLRCLGSVHVVLMATKAFMDVFAQMMTAAIRPGQAIRGFNKASRDGKKVPGWRVVRWLRDLPDGLFSHRDTMINHLIAAIDGWLAEAIHYRDEVAHSGQIQQYAHMALPFLKLPKDLTLSEIQDPRMPNGQQVAEYSAGIAQKILDLVDTTSRLLPGVQAELLGRER